MASHATAVFLGKHCPTPYDKTSHEITGGFAEPYCASTIRCYICCEFSSPSPGGILPQEMVHIPSNPSSLLQESVVERKKHQERLQALLVGWEGCLHDGTYLVVWITAVSTMWPKKLTSAILNLKFAQFNLRWVVIRQFSIISSLLACSAIVAPPETTIPYVAAGTNSS